MNFIVYYQVLLNTNVSININYFPGFYRMLESFTWFPSFTSTDMFLFSIIDSLKSYSFPKMEFIVIKPFDCFTILFFL
jgi:hypothetical protein